MLTLIDSLYINSYGGKILLDYLVKYIIENDNPNNYLFLFDSRLNLNVKLKISKSNIFILNPSEFERIKFYKKVLRIYNISNIFCFANVPPPINCKGKNVQIYFHNTLLYANNTSFNLKINFKNLYIKFLNKKYYKWIVQTNLVKSNLIKNLNIDENLISIYPFFNHSENIKIEKKSNFFFYPADGASQKNHIFLFKVWEKYYRKYSKSPILFVTIDKKKYPLLTQLIYEYKNIGLNIINLGHLNYNEIIKYYSISKFLIFPSLTESFGLPLLEACIYNCKIIAPNLEYVYEIINPSITYIFNSENDLLEKIHSSLINDKYLNYPTIKIKNNIIELIKIINKN